MAKPLFDPLSVLLPSDSEQSQRQRGNTDAWPKPNNYTLPKNNGGNWSQILQGLNLFSNTGDLYDFLRSYLINGNETTERNDLIYQYLLQLLSQNDQRNFDRSVLEEQRIYDSPLSQLLRLMSAGIGRDAAIDILNGGSNGSSLVGSGAGASAPGVPAPSGSIQQQAIANGINGFQALVGSFSQLLQAGLSVNTAINQNKLLAAQASMSQSSLQGYTAADNVINTLQQMEIAGTLPTSTVDSWTNADDMYKYLLAHKDSADISPLLQSGDFQTAFGSQSGREFINDFWKQRRSSRNDGTLAEEYLKQQKFQSAIMSMQPTKISAELNQIGASTANVNADTIVKYQSLIESANRIAVGEAQIQVLNKQGKWLDIQGYNQTRLTDSQVNLIDTQAYGQDIHNRQLALDYEYNSAGFPMLKQNRIDEITDEMNYWSTIKVPSLRTERMLTWMQNVRNARDAAYIENLRLNAVGSFAQENPALWNFCSGWHACGASEYVRTAIDGATSLIPSKKAIKALNVFK